MHTRAIEYLQRQRNAVGEINPVRVHGRVTRVVGLVMEGLGPGSSVGEFCHVYPKDGHEPIQCEVVGFSDDKILLMPLGDVRGIGPGSKIVSKRVSASVKVGPGLLGRTLDGLGSPLDGLGSFEAETEYPLYSTPPNPLSRKRIEEPLNVGIRAINSILTVGKGQRIGIFAGSGVGKSVLMGMMARNTEADVNVIGLIGERGREVKEFIEKDLGEEGLKRSVLVVATSDQPPLLRMRAPMVATAIAEYFRDQGKNVLLMMDSISRFCMAQREIGLAIGEPPATKGYPPSVFAHLPRLLERAGTSEGKGSITGFYTILAEGDDVNDPVADAARAVLDGHIVLSRELAHNAHYPAIDVLSSISRVMNDIVNPEHRKAAMRLRSVLSTYKKAYDLISIGAYKKGSDPAVDHAIEVIDRVNAFLKQDISEGVGYDNSLQALFALPA
ncbi:MAG: flagellar protein export ATPase FliI [Deltaproteobacteria bacterium]|nr:flagellar protein export ATPase FliI [Deltaproteobacteria bacterium]MBZ0219294.1 flagellar protein export ATPase FliI [Deltaproteobacteria bacterium]